MALPKVYSDGTASVANGSTAVTGTGTAWSGNIVAGDYFRAQGLAVRIASVESNGGLTLVAPWPGTALSGSAYEISFTPDVVALTGATRELRLLLGDGGVPLTLTAASSIASANIPPVVDVFRTLGYAAAGDYGGALWRRIAAPGTVEAWQRQSADGAYWEIADTELTTAMFASIQDGIDAASALNRPVFVPLGDHIISSTLVWRGKVNLISIGARILSDGTVSVMLEDEKIDDYHQGGRVKGLVFVGDAGVDVAVDITQTRYAEFEFDVEDCTKVGAIATKLHGSQVNGTFRHAIRNHFTSLNISACYNGIVMTRAPGFSLHEGPNFNQFDFGHVANFRDRGVWVEYGEGNRFYGYRNETSWDNTVAFDIDDTITTLIDCATDGIMFTSFVRIQSGSTGTINQITVQGLGLLASAVAFNTDLRTTASDVVTAINANSGTSGYSAELSTVGADIHIFTAAGAKVPQGTGLAIGFSGAGWDFMHSGPTDKNGGITGENNAWGIPEGHAGSNAIGIRVGDTGSAVLINPQGNGPKDRIVFESATSQGNTVIIRGGVNFIPPIDLQSFTVATMPTKGVRVGALAYCNNEVGGAVPAFFDGTSWRRLTDRAVVS